LRASGASPVTAEARPALEREEFVAAGTPPSEAPPWPAASDEEAFLAEGRAAGDPVPPAFPPPGEESRVGGDLPPLDELVGRIPPAVREALDDLFRAKFTGVRRVLQ